MNIAFLTEIPHTFKVPETHDNMRVEFAWMHAMDAVHIPISNYTDVNGYDLVVVIFPKGKTYLNSEGITMTSDQENILGKYLDADIISSLKITNKKVAYMQEGPTWFCNDYSIPDQFKYYNQIAETDIIFCHNTTDVHWYKGLFPTKEVYVLQSLMIDASIKDIKWKPEDKVIIGGNFCRWYGGFQSYFIADEFKVEKYITSMHNKREFEDQIEDLNHISYSNWLDWMGILSKFKYAVHLMPTVAAGTFSLNCAYFGIPCIGNEKLDTQRLCFPELSVDVEDIYKARNLALKLKSDSVFYDECSNYAKEKYTELFSKTKWLDKVYKNLNKENING